MKILRILPSIDPEAGGVQECVIQTGYALSEKGIIQDILTLDIETDTFLENYHFNIYPMGSVLTKKLGVKYGFSNKFMKWLTVNAYKYDKIIVDGIWQFHSFGAMRVLNKLNIEYYLYIHGMLDPWFKIAYPLKHLKKSIYWYIVEYWVLKKAKLVFFTCEEERVRAKKSFRLYSANDKVVPIGIKKPIIKKNKQINDFNELFPNLENKIKILFLSRINPKKGCDLLIKSFAKLFKGKNDYHLIMAGPSTDKYLEHLKDIASLNNITEQITWTGMISGDIKIGAYLTSDVFVLPSHQENFGIVVAEALACNLPVIISNKVNIWTEIENEGAGLICDDTEKSLNKTFGLWCDLDKNAFELMKKNSKTCFNNNFEIQNSIEKLIDTLHNN